MIEKIKDIYIYIDEAGTLVEKDENKYFILSCYITDSPQQIKDELDSLYNNIINEPYLAFEVANFKRQGFHACENHPDIRSRFYSLLLGLNIRIYSVVINKKSRVFESLQTRFDESDDLYAFFVRVLLKDRILSERSHNIHIIFEEYGSSIGRHLSNMEKVISRIIGEIKVNGVKDRISIDVEIHSKEDILLSVIDYTNFVIFQMLKDIPADKNTRMIANFKLIEPKIASLYSMHNAKHYNSRNIINFEEITVG